MISLLYVANVFLSILDVLKKEKKKERKRGKTDRRRIRQ